MAKKIVLIGAGSAMFTQGLVADLLRTAERQEWHLALVDTDPAALRSITALCRKMIDAKQSNVQLSSSSDRRDVLPGADYVVATVGVGGRRAWEQDVFIPRKYGVYQPVGDTAMPGGISRAMRMIPAMVDIVRDVQRICPDAYFFNYSNPMTVICRAIKKATEMPVIGLCHGVNYSEEALAHFAGVPRNEFTSYAVGVNHLTFMYKFFHKGKNALPLLREKYRTFIAEGGFEKDYAKLGHVFAEMGGETPKLGDPFAWEIFDRYGAFAAPGDRHICEFFPEQFPGGNYYGKTFGIDGYSFEKVIEYGDNIYADMDKLAHSEGPLPDDFFDKLSGEHEQLMDIIDSIENDKRAVFSVNVTNNGTVPNLPKDAVVEVPASATGFGFAPLQMNDFPSVLAQLLAKPIAIHELTVDAALTGDRNLFVEAVLAGGYLNDRSAVARMVDELIEAQIQYLPQFQ
ncbi:hypothetical protein [Paenibacillus montanisoli]|uniref:Glycosyl hydrolase family 4 C-terminal domain-containing protein n=1 Tax=Paenibacillus montanisoli TaxID=2081970 RepID=A0A328TWC3_9BACL|nr:hypothetical protein [Paenibacillus montanisoli]RAP74789.1 hypothetical protein DL346_22385 [Paenibacillus montanisoli]